MPHGSPSRDRDAESLVYIIDPAKQAAFLSDLELVETLDGGWTKRYVDRSGTLWQLYYPQSSAHGGGTRVLRTVETSATVAGWVTACLQSPDEDDALGVALDLESNPESWSEAIAALEAGRFGEARVRTFVEHLGVLAGINRRPVLGKRPDEVVADARAFAQLAERARALLAR